MTRLRPLTASSEDPRYAASLARILGKAGHVHEAGQWRDQAARRYGDLAARHPDAFADHAAEFCLHAGHRFVAYGLGNFLWWERSYSTATGGLELTIHPHAPLTARFVPAVVSGSGQPIADRGAVARQAAAQYASLRACAELAPRPS